jgi:hypothetical protein
LARKEEEEAAMVVSVGARAGFKGALINGVTQGRFLDDPFFTPLLERAEALGVPIYIHPAPPPEPVREAYFSELEPGLARMLSILNTVSAFSFKGTITSSSGRNATASSTRNAQSRESERRGRRPARFPPRLQDGRLPARVRPSSRDRHSGEGDGGLHPVVTVEAAVEGRGRLLVHCQTGRSDTMRNMKACLFLSLMLCAGGSREPLFAADLGDSNYPTGASG